MVRKWSYIKLGTVTSNLNLYNPINNASIDKTFKRYRFKVFRATTRFKKYTTGDVTCVVRKLPIQLKRKTTLINISSITSHWITHYLKLRQLNRFMQNIKLFNKQSNLPNIVVFNKTTDTLKYNGGVNITTCSWKIFKNLPTKNHPRLKGPYNANSFILTSGLSSYKQLELVNASITVYDKCAYPINMVSDKGADCVTSLLLKQPLHDNINHKVISVRRLSITLILKSIL